jgi:hypothetical protein
MENDEGNAKMEVLDATKKLNLVEENEPVQLDAVERQTEEVINESISSNYATDNGLKTRSSVCFVFYFLYLRIPQNSNVQRIFIDCCLLACLVSVPK